MHTQAYLAVLLGCSGAYTALGQTGSGHNTFQDVMGFNVSAFRTVGTFSLTFTEAKAVDILLIGGGGGGGRRLAAGGGAGALIFYPNFTMPAGTYNITVGAGAGMQTGTDPGTRICKNGDNGLDSYIANASASDVFRAIGGGGGGGGGEDNIGESNWPWGRAGGSGGGGGTLTNWAGISGGGADPTNVIAFHTGVGPGATGDSVYVLGHAGGQGHAPHDNWGGGFLNGGGGGGAGGAGVDCLEQVPGTGGPGASSITISGVTYSFRTIFGQAYTTVAEASNGDYFVAGGGGAGGWYESYPVLIAGGVGGGGFGTQYKGPSLNFTGPGKDGTGGGGGGGGYEGNQELGGTGGSGLVLIRYALPIVTTTTTPRPTTTTTTPAPTTTTTTPAPTTTTTTPAPTTTTTPAPTTTTPDPTTSTTTPPATTTTPPVTTTAPTTSTTTPPATTTTPPVTITTPPATTTTPAPIALTTAPDATAAPTVTTAASTSSESSVSTVVLVGAVGGAVVAVGAVAGLIIHFGVFAAPALAGRFTAYQPISTGGNHIIRLRLAPRR